MLLEEIEIVEESEGKFVIVCSDGQISDYSVEERSYPSKELASWALQKILRGIVPCRLEVPAKIEPIQICCIIEGNEFNYKKECLVSE